MTLQRKEFYSLLLMVVIILAMTFYERFEKRKALQACADHQNKVADKLTGSGISTDAALDRLEFEFVNCMASKGYEE